MAILMIMVIIISSLSSISNIAINIPIVFIARNVGAGPVSRVLRSGPCSIHPGRVHVRIESERPWVVACL